MRGALRWSTSVVAALLLHGAAAGLALGWNTLRRPDIEPQRALMLEVALAIEAPPSKIDNAPPAEVLARELPEPDTPPPVETSALIPIEAQVTTAEPPPPLDLKPPKPVERPRPAAAPAPPSQAAAPPIAPNPGPAIAAPRPGASRDDIQRAIAAWLPRLRNQIERHKQYPADGPRNGPCRITYVLIEMDRSGKILSVQTERSSGVRAFDREGIERVWRAQPLPPPPPEIPHERVEPVVPMDFNC